MKQLKLSNVTYKTEAIILRSYDIKEYDRMYTIFSREQGKMCVIGVGTRKPTAKLASGLEPLTESELFLVKGRKFDRVKGVIIDDQYPVMKKNLGLLGIAKNTARIIDQLAPEGEKNQSIYDSLSSFFGFLDRSGDEQKIDTAKIGVENAYKAKLLQFGLLWKLVQWTGQEPKVFQCAHCNSKLEQQDHYTMTFPTGVLCDSCAKGNFASSLKVSMDTVKLLRIFLHREYQIIFKIRCPNLTLRQAEGATKMMVEYLLGHRVEL